MFRYNYTINNKTYKVGKCRYASDPRLQQGLVLPFDQVEPF